MLHHYADFQEFCLLFVIYRSLLSSLYKHYCFGELLFHPSYTEIVTITHTHGSLLAILFLLN